MQARLWRVGALTLAAALAGEPSFAAPRFFASICDYADTGDVFGYVVMLSDAGRRPRVTLSWSEGAMVAPVNASTVAFDRKSGRLTFAAPRGSPYRFAGGVNGRILSGLLTGPSGPQRIYLEQRSPRLAYKPAGPCPSPPITPSQRR